MTNSVDKARHHNSTEDQSDAKNLRKAATLKTIPITEQEITARLLTLVEHFWPHCRPPLRVRDQLCEEQRIEGQSIELFSNRALPYHEGKVIEEAITKLKFIRSKDLW